MDKCGLLEKSCKMMSRGRQNNSNIETENGGKIITDKQKLVESESRGQSYRVKAVGN